MRTAHHEGPVPGDRSQSLRAAQPRLAFSTDIIVGFPGETDADFEDTQEPLRGGRLDMAYVFKYSVRSGTPAATMPGQVPEEVT